MSTTAILRQGPPTAKPAPTPASAGSFNQHVDFRLVGAQAADLKTLNDLLLEIRPRITRFVRVACPASGTTLASDRLDKYLNVVLNAAGQLLTTVTSPTVSQVYDFIKAFLLAVRRAQGGFPEFRHPSILPWK